MKRRISIISALLLALSFTGCSNNDAEVKALQEQVAKLEQQLNESEEEVVEEQKEETKGQKEKCAFCGKEEYIENLHVRKNSDGNIDYYFCDCGQGGKDRTTESNNTVVDPSEETYICDMCGKQGTCNEMECFNYVPEPVEEDVEADWEICYDCGEYMPPEYMEFNGRSYHCGCIYKQQTCPQCGDVLNSYGICGDCNGM